MTGQAVCGESRTHGFDGRKIPQGIYLSILEGLKNLKRLADYLNLDLTAQVAQRPGDYAILFCFRLICAQTMGFAWRTTHLALRRVHSAALFLLLALKRCNHRFGMSGGNWLT